jgi:hypothetical protein
MARQTGETQRGSGADRGQRRASRTRTAAPARQDGAPDQFNRNGLIFRAVAVYLIATFAYRVFVPAHESPLRTGQLLSIGLDLACFAGLVAIKKYVPGWWILFLVAFVSGLGLLAIRFGGDEGSWWTGHLYFTLEPR